MLYNLFQFLNWHYMLINVLKQNIQISFFINFLVHTKGTLLQNRVLNKPTENIYRRICCTQSDMTRPLQLSN